MEYASNGKANAALTTGIIGTAGVDSACWAICWAAALAAGEQTRLRLQW